MGYMSLFEGGVDGLVQYGIDELVEGSTGLLSMG